MLSQLGIKARVGFAGVALAMAVAGCAHRLESYPAPVAGTNWTASAQDTGSYGSGTSQIAGKFLPDRMWQGNRVHAFEVAGFTTLMTPGIARFIVQMKGDAPVLSWEPPFGWNWPLEVGKTWTSRTKQTNHAAKASIDIEYTQTVEAYEEVTVRAGTYKTFRVRTVTSIGDENVQWWSPDTGIFMKQTLKRSAKHPAGAGTRQYELVSFNRS